jgi:hypothetical protein
VRGIVKNTVFVLGLVVVGCGGSANEAPPAQTPATEAAETKPDSTKEEAAKEPETSGGIPTDCAGSGDECNVPKAFLSRLCASTFPNVALVLFGHGTPWKHMYLTRKTQAWNAEGGASVNDWLDFDEEVLVLASRNAPKGGMQVSGTGGFQALRWDGACVTLQSEEVTTREPPKPKHPRIEWRYIEDGMREALRKDSSVEAAFQAQHKECKGVSVGDVSKKCVDADNALGDAIVHYVEGTGGLPTPEKLP